MGELNYQGMQIYLQGAWAMLNRLYSGGFLVVNPQSIVNVKDGKVNTRQSEKMYNKALFDKLLSSRLALEMFLGEDDGLKPKYYVDERGYIRCVFTTPWEREKEEK